MSYADNESLRVLSVTTMPAEFPAAALLELPMPEYMLKTCLNGLIIQYVDVGTAIRFLTIVLVDRT